MGTISNSFSASKWDNLLNGISRAKTACEVSGHEVMDHFSDVGKMVDLGSGSQREIDDIMLKPLTNPDSLGMEGENE